MNITKIKVPNQLSMSSIGRVKLAKEQKYSSNTDDQCTRCEEELRKGPLSTTRARKELDILAPAARIYELRHGRNLNIQTHWTEEITEQGIKHRVALYVLRPGKYKEVKNG